MTAIHRTCTRCRDTLPLADFRKFATATGHSSWCKRCEREDWDLRNTGIRPIGERPEDEPGADIYVCQCQVAVLANLGACDDCGYPIVAAMLPRQQAVMDEKWPEWREQAVVTQTERAAVMA